MTGQIVHSNRVLIAVAVLCFSTFAFAHREPGSLTTIKWNQASEITEITHRLHSHDAELGIGDTLGLPGLSALDLAGRAHIALYVEENFHIAGFDGDIELTLIGAELVGDHVLVYQEHRGRLPAQIRIQDGILRDVYPEQVNLVNIEDRDTTRSLTFADDDTWHVYHFQK